MAYIEDHSTPGKPKFKVWIRIAGLDEPVPVKTFANRSLADQYARNTEARLRDELRQKKADPNGLSFYSESMQDAIALYLAALPEKHLHRSPLTAAVKHFPDLEMGRIGPQQVQDFADKMLATKSRLGRCYAGGTVHAQISALAQVYKWRAKKLNLSLPSNPFHGEYLPKGWVVKRWRRLAAGEERALFAEMRRLGRRHYHWRLLIKLALETGARQAEMFEAPWEEFNLETRIWSLPAERTKADAARSIPLSRRAVRTLRVLQLLRRPGEKGPFESLGKVESARGWFRDTVRKAGLVDFRFHDLRHEAVSRMVLHRRGLSTFEIMTIVGHSTLEMLQTYANLRGEELVERFDAEGGEASLMDRIGKLLRSHEAMLAALDGEDRPPQGQARAPVVQPAFSFNAPRLSIPSVAYKVAWTAGLGAAQ